MFMFLNVSTTKKAARCSAVQPGLSDAPLLTIFHATTPSACAVVCDRGNGLKMVPGTFESWVQNSNIIDYVSV